MNVFQARARIAARAMILSAILRARAMPAGQTQLVKRVSD
jgi:hypothetical protein